MNTSIKLTPRQIVFLGKLLNAEYIDYTYISAVGNIIDDFKKYEDDIRSELIAKGYISENFSGDVTVEDYVVELIKPLFFSTVESSLEVVTVGTEEKAKVYKFHIGDIVVLSTNSKQEFSITKIDKESIRDSVSSLVPEDYTVNEDEVVSEFNIADVTELITVKNVRLGENAIVKTFIKMKDIYYQESSEDVISYVTRSELVDGIVSVLTEVM